MTDLTNIKNIAYGELNAEDSRVLTRIYSTLLVDNDGELVVQFDGPSSLSKWCSISEEEGLSFYKYLLDNEILIQDTEIPRLLVNYKALPDKYRRKYSQ